MSVVSTITCNSPAHSPPAHVQSYAKAKPCAEKKMSPNLLAVPASTSWTAHSSIPEFKVVGLNHLWTLNAGMPTSRELMNWGKQAHWTVLWQLPKDVIVPATATFYGTFQSAITRVANTLSAEGLLLKADIYESNRTVVVRAPGESK